MIALDTHALLWWTLAPGQLGARATRAIAEADRLGVPTIVFWEIALLARKGRIELGASIGEWSRETLSLGRVEPLALTPEIAIAAEALAMHPDPADRFIVATALHHGVDLVSKDRLIERSRLVRTVW